MSYKKLSTNLSVACLILGLNTINVIPVKAELSPIKTQQQTTATDWFIQGLMKVNEENYDEAIKFFDKAIELNPEYAQAYYQRGLIHAKKIQGNNSNSDKLPPGCERVEKVQIICQFSITANWRETTKQKAIKDFTQAIQINPQYAAAYHRRGLLQQQEDKSKDFEQARNLYWEQFPKYLNQQNYQGADNILVSIQQLDAKQHNLDKLELILEEVPENPVGSSTASSNRKTTPAKLMEEARLARQKGDFRTACEKYKQAASRLSKNGREKMKRVYCRK
ncbi:MAG: tetratricopeptide repeat protein [Richelia sp. RM2_1_2]|nr:tetratricopeptide repeat protein [Richelia sp. RM2_1_2]